MLKHFWVGISTPAVATIVGFGGTVISYAQTSGQTPFEALSYCGQLDAIDRGGRSVAGFIADADDKAGYLWAVKTQCSWHNEQAALASQPDTSAAFENLSYCDQLDALDRAGKSVADFILSTSDPNGYIWAGRSQCGWHSGQANAAYVVLNPPASEPVTTRNPTYRTQEAFYPPVQQNRFGRTPEPSVPINPHVEEPPTYGGYKFENNSDF